MESENTMKDFEPLFVHVMNMNEEEWVNPDIEKYVEFDDDDVNAGIWNTTPVFRIWIIQGNKTFAHLVVKSDILDEYWNKTLANITSEVKRYPPFPRAHSKELKAEIEVCLREDVWMPGGKQFCFTEFGDKLGKLWPKKSWRFSHSPDVGICKGNDGTYSWST